MNSRLEALIKKGYPRELVIKLSSFTDEELDYEPEETEEEKTAN